MKEVDDLLNLLEDGQWHNLEDLEAKSSLSTVKVKAIIEFLADYGFIEVDKGSLKVKITDPTLRCFKQLKMIERDVAWKTRAEASPSPCSP